PLSKQACPTKGRADPERARSGSGVARPSGRPGEMVLRFFGNGRTLSPDKAKGRSVQLRPFSLTRQMKWTGQLSEVNNNPFPGFPSREDGQSE
ncbi:hypothetical protein, partial [Acetobacter cibinongensis]|uniref:hypothetical protein n=1 Tax=Acetobacter cibinongensis TaxID=146475 RepID=UPI00196A5249